MIQYIYQHTGYCTSKKCCCLKGALLAAPAWQPAQPDDPFKNLYSLENIVGSPPRTLFMTFH